MENSKQRNLSWLEVVYVVLLIVLAFAVLSAARPRIGLLDVSRLATELGIRDRITADAREWETDARTDLKEIQQKFTEQSTSLRAQLAAAASDAEKEAIQKEFRAATAELQKESAAIRERLAVHGKEVFTEFRSRLQPFIDEVARRKRVWMVLDRSSGVLYAIRQIDITDDVVRQARPSFQAEAEMPSPAPSAPADQSE
jgi:Skp family chaperone for outer membrane proteins